MSVNIKQSGSLKKIAAFLPNNLITVSSLPDTDITNIQAGQSLVYDGELSKWVNYSAKIVVTYTDSFKGETITCTKGLTVISKTAPLDSNTLIFYVSSVGTWVVTSGDFSISVTIDNVGDVKYAELLSVPEGATVTPTDDIQTWLACANITDKSYTTLAEVLADRATFETLIADSNACDYMARSTTWTSITVPTMTSYTVPSGEVISSGNGYPNYEGWKAFGNDANGRGWLDHTTSPYISVGQYVGYIFENPVPIEYCDIVWSYYSQANTIVGKIQGYDGSDWIDLTEAVSVTSNSSNTPTKAVFTKNKGTYESYRWVCTTVATNNYTYGLCLQFYGGIVNNADAMALIGKYDYCSNALLGNSTWASAIANSTYFESVLNVKVPVMTSNTTPSGECISTSEYSGRYTYYAFSHEDTPATSANNYWVSNATATPVYIGYKSLSAFVVNKIKVLFGLESGSPFNTSTTFILQGSNTGNSNDWHDIGSSITNTSTSVETYAVGNSTPYMYHRINITDQTLSGASYKGQVNILQFYGRSSNEVLVPLVPTMTSDTTPSGECICSGYATNQEAYKAFDSNDSTTWSNSDATYAGAYIGYKFPSSVKVDKIVFTKRNLSGYGTGACTAKIQGSNDNSTWVDLTNTLSFEQINTSTTGDKVSWDITQNGGKYLYYRLYYLTYEGQAIAGGLNPTTAGLQFYAKTVQTNIVHSCANDTIYYMDNGSPVIVATTNSDGDGILDFSLLEDQIYTFYSSVAKNPNDLTLDFCKRIRVTNSEYGGTTEMYLNPDATSMLYWYGYESDNLEDCLASTGWSGTYTYVSPTHNTASVTLTTTTSQLCGIGTKNAINASSIKSICYKKNDSYSNTYIITNGTKTTGSASNLHQVTNTSNALNVFTDTFTNQYASLRSAVGATMYVSAFWYERVTQHIPTFISASNDSLYILNGATKVYIANTDGEGKSYEPLLEAGTYTIYSSIAKDPSNLSNPYSKTITIDENTQTIVIMPTNVLYWYGYKSDNLEECTTTNGWSVNTYSMISPTYNATNMTLVAGSSQLSGVGTKSKVNLSTVKAIATGVTAVSGIYGVEAIATAKNISSLTKYIYLNANTMSLVSMDADTSGEYNITFYATAGRNNTLHALWYE